VRSGRDWFELEGGVDFGGVAAPMPALLEAARNRVSEVALGDGTVGLLPERWLEQWGVLAALGRDHGDALRVPQSQGWLLAALLESRADTGTEARVDEAFDRLRKSLRSYQGLVPAREPAGFRGELRPYQREGLAWLQLLACNGTSERAGRRPSWRA
jgi:hypothetical protein